jgi:hypothetical protein
LFYRFFEKIGPYPTDFRREKERDGKNAKSEEIAKNVPRGLRYTWVKKVSGGLYFFIKILSKNLELIFFATF